MTGDGSKRPLLEHIKPRQEELGRIPKKNRSTSSNTAGDGGWQKSRGRARSQVRGTNEAVPLGRSRVNASQKEKMKKSGTYLGAFDFDDESSKFGT